MNGGFCANCGAALQAGARFCVGCGTPVENQASQPGQYGQPQGQPHVGQGYQQGYPQQGYAQPTPAKSRRPLVIGAALVAAALAGVAVLRPDILGMGSNAALQAIGSLPGVPNDERVARSGDKMIDALVAAPVPPQLASAWTSAPMGGADVKDRSELEPGETGAAYLFLVATDNSTTQVEGMVTAYTDAQTAQTALNDVATSGYAPEMLASVGVMAIAPQGLTGRCMGIGSMVSACHVMAGRSIVFFRFAGNGQPVETASALLAAYLAHVQSLGG